MNKILKMIVALMVVAHVAQAQTTTYTGPSTTGADTWNVPANWDNGVPMGSTNVIISASNPYVTAWSASTPTYSGNLTMQDNTTLQIGWTTMHTASWNAIGTAGSTIITMGDGVYIKSRTEGSPSIPEIVLLGDARVQLGESTQTPASPTFGHPITGAHKFTLMSNASGPTVLMSASNSFSHLEIQALAGRGGSHGTVKATVAGALGLNAVTIIPVTAYGAALKLELDASGVMSPTGTLNLAGSGPAGNGLNVLQLDADNTIGYLTVDTFAYPTGTYSRVGLGTADYEYSWISGNSILTVTNAPADATPPELLSINAGGASHFYLDKQTSLTYTLTFNEPIDVATVTVDDFENAGTAPVTISSVTQTTAVTFNVVVSPTGEGTLTLRVKASIDDLFGNTLAAPVTDDHTILVEATTPKFYLIYEPFAQTAGSISGKAGGTGLNAWAVVSVPTVATTPTLAYGQLPSSGGQLIVPSGAGVTAYATITSALADAGLLADGATLWFSFLYRKVTGSTANERSGWAFGTDHLITSGTFGAFMSNSGNGLGMWSNGQQIRPAAWLGGGEPATVSGTNIVYGSTVLVVGRIVWGATPADDETITLWTPDQTNIPADVVGLGSGWSTTMTGVDQTQFNTISMQQRNSGGDQTYDEIRFGPKFEQVMGIAPPPSGTVLMLK